jgi:transcriptional regulator with XRE-family HTH domain
VKRIAQNIKLIRKKKGLTQEQVAERAGISVKFLSDLERGVKRAGTSTVVSLSKALSEPICSLLDEERCPFQDDGLACKLVKLLAGRRAGDIDKAMRVIKIILE